VPKVYVTFLWNEGFRNYLPEHVNMQSNALKYWDKDCKVVCITDETKGFNKNVTVVPLPDSAKSVRNIEAPQGKMFPSSYRRLWLFSNEARSIGDRVMLLDVDAMILNDLSPLWDIDADFVGWRPIVTWGREDRIGGGTWLHKTGTLPWLWDGFTTDPQKMIQETRAMGFNGSDQAIMSRFLYHRYPHWDARCGIYAAQDGVMEWDMPPTDARIVHFNGAAKIWDTNKLWVNAYCNRFKDA